MDYKKNHRFDTDGTTVEDLFRLVKIPLDITRDNIQRLRTSESKFDAVRSSFLDSLTKIINETEEQENFLRENLVQDHLVIAFFGHTNAGKSTIIDTFRIIFDEETRRNAINNRKEGVDGTIVGDGHSDFTKTYDEYDMTIDGRRFTLIDVPGIEGNEAEYKEGIKKALQKAHCVFYVHGSDAKPNTKTTEKIKEYLNDWVEVYTIRNIRGGSEDYDEEEERETLLTDKVLRASKLCEDVFKEVLGKHYKGNINIQGLLALCAKANFSPARTDLIGTQSDLIESFGSAKAIFYFSRFLDVIEVVRDMSDEYKELIIRSNKDKVKALAQRAINEVNNCISKEKEDIANLDLKLKTFERNIYSARIKAEQRLNVRAIVEKEFDAMRTALYNAIDTGKEDTVKSVATQQCRELETRLAKQIRSICSDATQWYSEELQRLKRDLDSRINMGTSNIPNYYTSVKNFNADSITSEMKDFDFGSAISTAMTAAGIAALIPGVGWVLGGVIALVGAFFGGLFGNDGKSEAKQKVDATINKVCEETISQLNNGTLKEIKNHYRKVENDFKYCLLMEENNIQNLKGDVITLRDDMKEILKSI